MLLPLLNNLAVSEIDIEENAINLTSGVSEVNFGNVLEGGTNPSKTFVVYNNGSSPLTISSVVVPSGYIIVQNLPASITQGTSEDLIVELDSTTAGAYSGDITISSNDPDEGSFVIGVTGGVTLDFPFETSGGILFNNLITPTDFGVSPIDIDLDLIWGVQGEIYLDLVLSWGACGSVLYVYRVETEVDDNISFYQDGSACECSTKIYHIAATCLTDLCQKMKRAFLNLPITEKILSIKKFTRPLYLDDIDAEEEAGIDHSINNLIDIDFCASPECFDFCLAVDDSAISIGGGQSHFLRDYVLPESSGGISFSGSSSFEFVFESDGGLVFGGENDSIADFYELVSSGEVLFSGESDLVSTYWIFESSGDLDIYGDSEIESTSHVFESTGSIVISGGIEIEYTYSEIGFVLFSGESVYHITDYVWESGGEVSFFGSSDSLSDYYELEESEGLEFSGNSVFISSGIEFEESGGFEVSGGFVYQYNYVEDGGFEISGESDLGISVFGDGGVEFFGESEFVSSAWEYESDGLLEIFGTTTVKNFNLGIFESIGGGEGDLNSISFKRSTTPVTNIVDIISDPVEVPCGCGTIPRMLYLRHNLNQGNDLIQFLTRNSLSFPDVVTLKYQSKDNTWRYNKQMVGIGSVSNTQEKWKILLEWSCSSQTEQIFEDLAWRFSYYIYKVVNGRTDESKGIYKFVTADVCSVNPISFDFSINTQLDGVPSSRESSFVGQNVFYDNIGLFLSKYWERNKNLNFFISTSNLLGNPEKLDIQPIFGDIRKKTIVR